MLTCKIHPRPWRCRACIDVEDHFGMVPDCSECMETTYELISTGTSFWSGDYAMVVVDGQVERISLDRIYDVKEKSNEQM